jgi:hypothetical protein
VVEGAPLLRAYGSKAHRGFESLPLRQWLENARGRLRDLGPRGHGRFCLFGIAGVWFASAPVAQLDRAPGYEPGGREFESLRARQLIKNLSLAAEGPLSNIPGRV